MNKPNCYECKFRGSVPGSVHSSCQHPSTRAIQSNPIVQLMGIMGGGAIIDMDNTLNIIGNPHGIRKGWFAWPVNFDPVWLENCDGFTEKE